MTNDINKVKVMGSNLAMDILPSRNTLNVTAYMDQPSQTRQPSLRQRLMAVAPGELEREQGFPSLLLG